MGLEMLVGMCYVVTKCGITCCSYKCGVSRWVQLSKTPSSFHRLPSQHVDA